VEKTKLFISAFIRGEDCTTARRYNVTVITLSYILALSHNTLELWRKDVASKSYRSGHKEAVIVNCSYRSGNILAVIASESYCCDS
jgi:hypothetical protein